MNLTRFHRYQRDTNDCGPYAATIAANGLRGGFVYDPEKTAREMRYRWPNGVTPPWAMTDWLRRQGFKARVTRKMSKWHLTGCFPCRLGVRIVMVGGWHPFWIHWKCVESFDLATGIWSFVDSAYPVPVSNENMATFLKEWNPWRLVIEASVVTTE